MNHSTTESILDQRQFLDNLGYNTLPLRGKLPYQKGWPKRTPASLWRTAGHWDNIGIRAGGALGVAVIDADDKSAVGTVTSVERFLFDVGLNRGDYPLVMTPSGGSHSYFSLTGDRPEGNYTRLAEGLAGEFRYGVGSQTVAPPSTTDTGHYALIAGDWSNLPTVTVSQLVPLLTADESTHSTPLPDAYTWPLDIDADLMLQTALTHAQPGTRHNMLLGLVRRLRGAGHTQDTATALALAYQEQVTQADNPFPMKEALSIVKYLFLDVKPGDTAGVAKASQALEFAELRDWPGRTRHTDRIVFEAHAMIAIAANVSQWHAPVRRLAEMANTTRDTASRANRRLLAAGLLAITKAGQLTNANEFRFREEVLSRGGRYRVERVEIGGSEGGDDGTLAYQCTPPPPTSKSQNPIPINPICPILSQNDALLADVFSYNGLGRSSLLVWLALGESEMPAVELAELANVSRRTTERCLAGMAKHGVVTKAGKLWRRIETPLEDVAEALGVRGTAERREALHSEQSQEWAELVAINEHKYRSYKMEDARLARETKHLTDARTRTERLMDSDDQYITTDGHIETVV